ncbi:AAA family ATPase [Mesorhizobium sp. M1E.F.Ca.ET.063.01.1.1]|uniref:AAA family ATPase n=1 Tax=Mesorhizobium sp. M1E.F.Ca.ET.063.01.1.1 TaxID=2496750 RepID=UPI000FCA44A4|nr:AAA family ATPase [Mesorhizobium sp. M1E.F.Ca.ET.063.01.1.1]RUW85123.1 hypothetical protein EOA29_06255 [Mesorhizobium sp. M1E.F.Ca.ET.063.01.1.1]
MPRDANDILREEGEAILRDKIDRMRREHKHPYDSNTRYRPEPDATQPLNRSGHAQAQERDRPPKVRLLNYRQYRAENAASAAGASLVKGLIRVGTLVSLNGRPGAAKTALMVELAKCLDAGEPFLGRETKQTVVAYIAAEDEIDVVNRLEALELDSIMIVVSEEGVPLTRPDRATAIVREAITQAREMFPGREVFIPFDTLRAGLDGQSVLEDKFTSPALNRLRKLAEDERVVICMVNHTNRENPKQTKGETLEAVVATELILLEGEGGWFEVHVGKNRSGPPRKQLGRLRCTSISVGDVEAAIVDEIETVEPSSTPDQKARKFGGNQALILRMMRNALFEHGFPFRPFGPDGPQVKAVKEAVLREEFIERKAGNNREYKRRGFNEALNRLLDAVLMRGENADGEGVIWHAERHAETGKPENFQAPGEEP